MPAFGYSSGNVGGAGGEADTDLTFFSVGARFAPNGLERGLFVDADASAGYLDYESKRELGGGLGTAKGDSHGNLTGATLALGYRVPVNGVTLEPSLGVRISHVNLSGFQEKGSELALDVDGIHADPQERGGQPQRILCTCRPGCLASGAGRASGLRACVGRP